MAKRKPLTELRGEYSKLTTQIRRLWKKRDGIGGQIARRTLSFRTGDLVVIKKDVQAWGALRRKSRYRVLAILSEHDGWGEGREPVVRVQRVKGRKAELHPHATPFAWRASDFEKRAP